MRDFAREAAADSAGAPFQRERQTVFAAHWLVFAASEQMPATGDYVMRNLGGWLLFAIRGEDGIARAFHNLCRHQGVPVVGVLRQIMPRSFSRTRFVDLIFAPGGALGDEAAAAWRAPPRKAASENCQREHAAG